MFSATSEERGNGGEKTFDDETKEYGLNRTVAVRGHDEPVKIKAMDQP